MANHRAAVVAVANTTVGSVPIRLVADACACCTWYIGGVAGIVAGVWNAGLLPVRFGVDDMNAALLAMTRSSYFGGKSSTDRKRRRR